MVPSAGDNDRGCRVQISCLDQGLYRTGSLNSRWSESQLPSLVESSTASGQVPINSARVNQSISLGLINILPICFYRSYIIELIIFLIIVLAILNPIFHSTFIYLFCETSIIRCCITVTKSSRRTNKTNVSLCSHSFLKNNFLVILFLKFIKQIVQF